MKKQYKSSITLNHNIKEIYIFDGVALKGYVVICRFCSTNEK